MIKTRTNDVRLIIMGPSSNVPISIEAAVIHQRKSGSE